MALRGFGKKKRVHEQMELTITPLADVLTFLLVFLLKTFSGGDSSLAPSAEIDLVTGRSDQDIPQALAVQVSPSGVIVDEKSVTKLHDFVFEEADIGIDGNPRSLVDAFVAIRARQAEPKGPYKVNLVADAKAPFSTIRRVMASAEGQGFTDFRLVVLEEE